MEEGLRAANETLKVQLAEIEALQAQLRDQAIRDSLTGVLNRRYLSETLGRETARARRDSRAYAVVILDLDHFKRINDTYGHEAGDRVLVAVAELLRAHTREGDLVCRYGGEEFVVLMPGSSAVSAARRAEVWRDALEAQPFTLQGRGRRGHPVGRRRLLPGRRGRRRGRPARRRRGPLPGQGQLGGTGVTLFVRVMPDGGPVGAIAVPTREGVLGAFTGAFTGAFRERARKLFSCFLLDGGTPSPQTPRVTAIQRISLLDSDYLTISG